MEPPISTQSQRGFVGKGLDFLFAEAEVKVAHGLDKIGSIMRDRIDNDQAAPWLEYPKDFLNDLTRLLLMMQNQNHHCRIETARVKRKCPKACFEECDVVIALQPLSSGFKHGWFTIDCDDTINHWCKSFTGITTSTTKISNRPVAGKQSQQRLFSEPGSEQFTSDHLPI